MKTGVTFAIWGRPWIAEETAEISAESTTISTGVPSPLGKCSPNLSRPITESVLEVKPQSEPGIALKGG